MTATQGIELLIEVMDDLDKKFTTLPNALLRGDQDTELGLDFRGYTLRERCLLAALYGMKTGYRCSRDRVDRLAPELGRDAVDTVLRGLKKRGNLVTTRRNDPQHRGRFIWHWQVSLRPIAAGQSIPGSSGDGAGVTVPGSSIPGSSVHGSSTRGPSGSYKEEEPPKEEELGVGRNTNNSLSEVRPQGTPAAAESPEREIPSEPQTPKNQDQAVDALVAEALRLHPGWAPRMVRKAIVEELGDGRPFEKVAAAWRACIVAPSACSPSPGRFKHAGPWWDAAYGQPSATNKPTPRTAAIAECPRCDPSGWVLDRDLAERCDHRTPAKVGAA